MNARIIQTQTQTMLYTAVYEQIKPVDVNLTGDDSSLTAIPGYIACAIYALN